MATAVRAHPAPRRSGWVPLFGSPLKEAQASRRVPSDQPVVLRVHRMSWPTSVYVEPALIGARIALLGTVQWKASGKAVEGQD